MQEQVDALGVQFAQEVQQIDQRPAQAIDRPGRDHVDVVPGNGLEQAIEARPLVAALGAGDTGVLEKLDQTVVRGLTRSAGFPHSPCRGLARCRKSLWLLRPAT
jgi:hypothetical protein